MGLGLGLGLGLELESSTPTRVSLTSGRPEPPACGCILTMHEARPASAAAEP